MLTTVVFGALTGVGIWFIIGLLNPKATEALIHHFVWGWATEWTFFVIEILAAILYFYGWKRMSAKNHMRIGWIYFWAAWLSLVIIVGIVTFMLTPGRWLETGDFWDGFLNPTYLSSVFLRTGICIALAGLFALLVASRYPAGALKERLVRGNALWAIAGIVITGACWFWYRAGIPEATYALASNRLSIAASALARFQFSSYALLGLLIGVGLLLPRFFHVVVALILMVVGLYWFGAYEWFREASRKPYVIHGYMYGNGMRVGEEQAWRRDGLLSHVAFRTGDDAADLYRYACQTCHQVDGYNPIKPAFDHTDPAFIAGSIYGLAEDEGLDAALHGIGGGGEPARAVPLGTGRSAADARGHGAHGRGARRARLRDALRSLSRDRGREGREGHVRGLGGGGPAGLPRRPRGRHAGAQRRRDGRAGAARLHVELVREGR